MGKFLDKHFISVFFIVMFISIGFATKYVVDRIPEEHPVATGYYRTSTWLCDVDIDGKSFPVKLEGDFSWHIRSYDFPNKINEESLLEDSKGHVHICVPLYGYVSD